MRDFIDYIETVRREGRPAALATVIGIEGGSSSRLGARMFVTADGRRHGTLTVGGCVDGRAAEEAASVIAGGGSRRIAIVLGDDEPDFGMSCAGTVHVYVEKVSPKHLRELDKIRLLTKQGRQAVFVTSIAGEYDCGTVTPGDLGTVIDGAPDDIGDEECVLLPATTGRPDLFLQSFAPPRLLVVVGTGPVARPLITMARQVGYRTCVVDSRDIVGFDDADELRTGIPSEVCKQLDLDARSAVIIASHDYKNEVPVLREVLGRDVGFVGFLASERRGQAVLNFLETTGTGADLLEQVRVPVGHDIGAMTPSEIAVSILSEMLAVRNGRTGGSMKLERAVERTGRFAS